MRRINPLVLLGLTPFGFAVGYLLDWAVVGKGGMAIPVPWSLTVGVALVAALVVALASRVRAATRPEKSRRIDPIAAYNIVQLARATAVAGALMVGATVGILVFLLTRPVVSESLVPSTIGGVVASGVLVVAGLVAERLCMLPPDDRDGDPA